MSNYIDGQTPQSSTTPSLYGERNLELAEVVGLIKRHAVTVLVVCVVVFTATALILKSVPKKFKSTATLNITSSYFSNPLTRELVPEPSEPGELNAQRIALLQYALGDDYLDGLGEQFSLFEYPRGTSRHLEEREQLRKRIEYFTLNPTTVQVSFVHGSGKVAFLAMEEILKRMVAVLIEERYKNLEKARDAIQEQTKFLARSLTKAKKVSNAKTLDDELSKVNISLAALRQKYTERHPEVAELRNKAQAMAAELARATEGGKKSKDVDGGDKDVAAALALEGSSPEGASSSLEKLYDDLLKKLSYLNIALTMERGADSMSSLSILQVPSMPTQPFFPNPKLALVLAGLASAFLSIGLIIISETRRRVTVSPTSAAIALNTRFLGELPPMDHQNVTALISFEERRSLPPGTSGDNQTRPPPRE